MKQVELYNHNKTTYENITRIFETSNKCATVQPTGSGKSFIIFKLAQDNSDKTIIVFEPNRQIIGRVSEQMKEYGIDNIKFYTYQKLNSQHKRDEISIANADYICLDELHRIKAKQWEQAVIAIQEKFPNAKVLGLTATPERMDGQNIVDYFGAELACNITLGDAIVNKILPCPTYISALYTFDEEIQKVSEKIDESRNSDEEKNEMRAELNEARKQLENALGVPAILKKHIPDSNGKYLVFCQNVEHLNTMKSVIGEWFAQAGFDVNMYEVHTKNPNHKIEYNQFQADNSEHIKLCLCIDMFNEGVHLEGISGVILLRPTQSNIIYFQQIGRAISASDNNTPIIFDLVNNSNSLGGGNLRTEIKSAVERQREEITECSNECDKEVFDISNFHIYDYIKDSLDVFYEIESQCNDNWNYHFNQFIEYKNKYGHGAIIKEYAQHWDGLYDWAKTQRNLISYKKAISDNHYKLLMDNEFVLDLSYWKKEYHFFNGIEHLKKYLNTNNLPVPKNYICDDMFKLGSWYSRILYHRDKLPKEWQSELSNCGITIDKIASDDKWMNNYQLALMYMNNSKNQLNKTTIFNGYNIGQWYANNKKLYKTNKLSSKRCQLFSQLLDKHKCPTHQQRWDNSISILSECLQNDIIVNKSTIYKDCKIGLWLQRIKRLYKTNHLAIERYQQLLELGIDLAKEGSLM